LPHPCPHRQSGATLIEVLAVVAVLGLSVGAAALRLQPLETPLDSGVRLVQASLRQARLNAIASTSAYQVIPLSADRLTGQFADSCSATSWSTDSSMAMNLPQDVSFTSTSWAVCFSARGISDGNVTITLDHDTAGQVGVEVLVGGTTRVQ
jgi:prepilin-type N-terminal cleavage/methylation domain-containing protein